MASSDGLSRALYSTLDQQCDMVEILLAHLGIGDACACQARLFGCRLRQGTSYVRGRGATPLSIDYLVVVV